MNIDMHAAVWVLIFNTNWTTVGLIVGLIITIKYWVCEHYDTQENAWFLLGRYRTETIKKAEDLYWHKSMLLKRVKKTIWILTGSFVCGFVFHAFTQPQKIPEKLFSNEAIQLIANLLATQSFFSGVVLLILAAGITLAGVRYQTKSNIVTKTRQHWINSLRKQLAALFSTLVSIDAEMSGWQKASKNGNEADRKKYAESTELLATEFQKQFTRLKLMLNPKEPDHKDLVSRIEKIIDKLLQIKPSIDLPKERDDLVKLSQAILKREWERVKGIE